MRARSETQATDPRFWALLGLWALVMGAHLATPGLDSDQAVTGLMGLHVLRGEFPVFFWGQDHAGVPEAYLAAVTFSFLGVSRFTLNLVPAAVAAGTLVVTYRLAVLLFGRGAGLLALLFMAVAPPYVAAHYVLARAYYIEQVFLGQLVLLLAARAAFLPLRRGTRDRTLLVLGLASGLGFSFGFQIVPALGAAALTLWASDPGLPRRRGAWLAAGGFLLGSLAFWAANLARDFATFQTAVRFAERWPLAARLARAAELAGVLLGVREYLGQPAFLPGPLAGLVPAVVGAALVALAWEALRGRCRDRCLAPRGALLLLAFLALGAGLPLWGGYLQVPRYLVPLYPALAVALGRLGQRLGQRSTVAAATLVALFVVPTGWALVQTVPSLSPGRRAAYWGQRAEDARLARDLEAVGLNRLYAFDYWLAPRLTFDTGERLIVALPHGDRYPPYTAAVDAAPRAGYLFRGEVPRWFERAVTALGAAYRVRTSGPYSVAYEFSPPPPVRPLARETWRIVTGSEDRAALVADRDVLTAWHPTPGARLEVRFDAPEVVQAVGLVAGPGGARPPPGLSVEISADGRSWQPVATIPGHWPLLVWDHHAPRVRPGGESRVQFPATPARALRLTSAGNAWESRGSLAELFLYGPGTPPPEPAPLARARTAAERGDWRQAARGALEAVQVAPHHPEAHGLLSQALYRLRLPPGPPERVGEALERIGLAPLAAHAYREALAELPTGSFRSVPAAGLARTLEASGATAEARRWQDRVAGLSGGLPPGPRFGSHLRLLALSASPDPVRAGASLSITFRWEALSPPRRRPVVFVHLVRAGTRLVGDHALLGGHYTPDRWRPGEILEERTDLAIPGTAPPGRYRLVVGVWFPETGERLRVWHGWLPTRRDRLVARDVEILATQPAASGERRPEAA